MNKILLATTALVATAGVASADVALSGWAEIGLVDDGVNDVQFHHDMDVRFTLSGETDGGLTFGATIDLDEVSSGISADASPAAVFISGGFGTVTMGDTDGAYDWAMADVAVGGAIADDHTAHGGYNDHAFADAAGSGRDGQVLRYDNTFGDFGVALSAQLDESGGLPGNDDSFGLGLRYNAALGGLDLGLGLAVQDNGANTIAGLSVDTTFANGLRAILNYSDLDGAVAGGTAKDSHTALGLAYTSGALTVSANYGSYDGTVAANDAEGYGLAVNYDLGGAEVQFGYGDTDGGNSTWSLGLAMSF
ncbi:porin [Thalassobius sp. I31.1]|uniref:porin n=1 Tax=Thalassobius sp. I31.1 TaxID=2109912 RepID=UPI000D198E08|nr:porin [Thalassobius sp. I31.1]